MPVVWIFILLCWKRGKTQQIPWVISNQQGYMYIKLIFSQSVVWSGNIFSSVAIFLIIALGTSGYFSIVMIFWLHILKNHYFFFFGYIVLNFMFLLFTSFRSLLSKWFALAAQIYLNRDSLKIVSVLICIEGGKMRIINIIFVAVLFWLSACLS